MATNKIQKSKVNLQRNGLIHLGYLNSSDAIDGGFTISYNDGTQKYAGLFRDASDSGNFVLFKETTVNPLSPDTVDTGGAGFDRGDLKLGTLDADVSITSAGDISSSSGNLSASSGSVTGGNVQLSGNSIISTDTNGNVSILPNGTGEVLLKADPVSALGAVTKQYADSIASGLDPKESCRVKTVSDLEDLSSGGITAAGSGVGKTLTRAINSEIATDSAAFDGVTLVLNDRVLVTEQGVGAGSSVDNGIYYVSDVGSVGSPWVLTRDTDFDTSDKVTAGAHTFIEEGSTADNTGWVLSTNDPITIDTTGLSFTIFTSQGSTTASNLGAGSDVFKTKLVNDLQFRTLIATNATNSTNILELVENTDDITFNIDQLKITGTGSLNEGSITSGFGSIDNGASSITTTGTITGGILQTTSSLLSMSTSVLTFGGLTGENELKIPDNLADAFSIKENTTSYMTFVTTNGSEEVSFPQGKVSFSSTTGQSILELTDNLADALSFKQGANSYLTFVTTDASETVQLNQSLTTVNGDIVFNAASGSNLLSLQDNLTDALSVKEGSNSYMQFVTTNGSENILFSQPIETSNGSLTFSAATGNNKINIPDNLADALTIGEGANAYITLTSTDASEEITLVKNTTVSGTLDVNGNTTTLNSGLINKVSDQNTTALIDTTVYMLRCDATAGAIVITLPNQATSVGVSYKIYKTDNSANTVTIAPSSGDELDFITDDTLVLVNQGDHSNVECIGSLGWIVN